MIWRRNLRVERDRDERTEEPKRIDINSDRGAIRGLFHRSVQGTGAVVMFGGIDGGFDGPADSIYPTLAADLLPLQISSLRLDFRRRGSPGIVEEGVHDVLKAVEFLNMDGLEHIGLVGHSFGGAVAIESAARSPDVDAVVALSPQTAGAQRVADIAPRPILFIHGEDDRRLPPRLSRFLYGQAGEPKELVILSGARHSLRRRRERLRRLLIEWLTEKLA
jgi:hypothetical protein